MGCNIVIVLQRFRLDGYWKVYCNTLYCIAEKEWAAGKLYCNMSSCIARGWLGQEIVLQETVLQYSLMVAGLYCKRLGWEENCVAIQILYCRLVELAGRLNCIAIQFTVLRLKGA